MRKLSLNRWNWSQKAGKWVFVVKGKNGKRQYYYNLEPPKQFTEIVKKIAKTNKEITKLNELINRNSDEDETFERANNLYVYLQTLGEQLQAMGRN